MGDLTENFSRSEFECSCGECDQEAVDFELVNAMQDAVDHFTRKYNQRIRCKVLSGNRCVPSNVKALMKWSGKTFEEAMESKSKHLFSMASDHRFKLSETNHLIDPDEVADYYESKYPNRCGIGRYKNRTHLDMRALKARWNG